jgi:hypothetical protein
MSTFTAPDLHGFGADGAGKKECSDDRVPVSVIGPGVWRTDHWGAPALGDVPVPSVWR